MPNIDQDLLFMTSQPKALTTSHVFGMIDWPSIFGVQSILEVLKRTYHHPVYLKIVLEF